MNSFNTEEYIERVDKILKDKFSESLPKHLEESVTVELEGPNFVFKDRSIEASVISMKFRDNTDHTQYANFLGMNNVLLVIPYNKFWGDDLAEVINKKMKVAIEVTLALARNNVFMEENSTHSLQVI